MRRQHLHENRKRAAAILSAPGCCYMKVRKQIFRLVGAEPGIPCGADIVVDEVKEDFHFGSEPGGSEGTERDW